LLVEGAITLAPAIGDYLQAYKGMRVELDLNDRFVDLVNEGFDVAIRIGELSDSSLVARRFAMFQEAICASPDYLAEHGIPRIPEDLTHHQCLGFTNWRTQNGWNRVVKKSGRAQAESPRFFSNNAQALRAAAIKGAGLILMPQDLIREDLQNGNLVEVLHELLPPVRPIHAVYPRELQHLAKLNSFVEHLVGYFKHQRA
jgi:DNA-binding transcriptional LysR family regulator